MSYVICPFCKDMIVFRVGGPDSNLFYCKSCKKTFHAKGYTFYEYLKWEGI